MQSDPPVLPFCKNLDMSLLEMHTEIHSFSNLLFFARSFKKIILKNRVGKFGSFDLQNAKNNLIFRVKTIPVPAFIYIMYEYIYLAQ